MSNAFALQLNGRLFEVFMEMCAVPADADNRAALLTHCGGKLQALLELQEDVLKTMQAERMGMEYTTSQREFNRRSLAAMTDNAVVVPGRDKRLETQEDAA